MTYSTSTKKKQHKSNKASMTQDKINAIKAVIIGTIATIVMGIYVFHPLAKSSPFYANVFGKWWFYAIVWLVAIGSLTKQFNEFDAHKNMANRK
jgi:hypothetical protein